MKTNTIQIILCLTTLIILNGCYEAIHGETRKEAEQRRTTEAKLEKISKELLQVKEKEEHAYNDLIETYALYLAYISYDEKDDYREHYLGYNWSSEVSYKTEQSRKEGQTAYDAIYKQRTNTQAYKKIEKTYNDLQKAYEALEKEGYNLRKSYDLNKISRDTYNKKSTELYYKKIEADEALTKAKAAYNEAEEQATEGAKEQLYNEVIIPKRKQIKAKYEAYTEIENNIINLCQVRYKLTKAYDEAYKYCRSFYDDYRSKYYRELRSKQDSYSRLPTKQERLSIIANNVKMIE